MAESRANQPQPVPHPVPPAPPESAKRKRAKAPNWLAEDELSFLRLVEKHAFNYVTVISEMTVHQHRAVPHGFDVTKATKKYRALVTTAKYKQPYEQTPYKAPPKKQRTDKYDSARELVIHAETEAKHEAVHKEIQELLKRLNDDEIVGTTMDNADTDDVHQQLVEGGKQRKAAREEKSNKWHTYVESDTNFRESMISVANKMLDGLAKSYALEERKTAIEERYLLLLEKNNTF